jgi:glycosidase
MNATDQGFIDANNWLFTSRGIPVVYQGSELGFMRGKAEHQGNRNYLGQDNIEIAKTHPIHAALSRIANLRKKLPALQNGLQVNVELAGNKAAFYRVLVKDEISQIALVLLNKGDEAVDFQISKFLQQGQWTSQLSGDSVIVGPSQTTLQSRVKPHDVQVWLFNDKVTNDKLINELTRLMRNK